MSSHTYPGQHACTLFICGEAVRSRHTRCSSSSSSSSCWGHFWNLPMCSFSEVCSKVARFFNIIKTQVTVCRGVFKSCQILQTHLPSNISRIVFKEVCSKRCVQRGVIKEVCSKRCVSKEVCSKRCLEQFSGNVTWGVI